MTNQTDSEKQEEMGRQRDLMTNLYDWAVLNGADLRNIEFHVHLNADGTLFSLVCIT